MAPTLPADSQFKLQGGNYLNTNRSSLSQYCISEKREFLGAYTKLQKGTVRFVMPACLSVSQNGTTRFPLDGFS